MLLNLVTGSLSAADANIRKSTDSTKVVYIFSYFMKYSGGIIFCQFLCHSNKFFHLIFHSSTSQKVKVKVKELMMFHKKRTPSK